MKRHVLKKYLAILFIIQFTILYSFSYAQEKKTADQINASDLIVIGNVKEVKCEWDDNRENIWTYITVECNQTLKGNNKSNNITIRSLGGTIGELSQEISGAPKFEVGEILLSFLSKDKNNNKFYYCIGGELGKYRYKDDNWIQNNMVRSNDFIKIIQNTVNAK